MLLLFLFALCSHIAVSENNKVRISLNDSLLKQQLIFSRAADSLNSIIRSQRTEIRKLNDAVVGLNNQLKRNERTVQDLQGDNLQSAHTNSILFILNLSVGLILLIAIIWMLVRKKPEHVKKMSVSTENLEYRLDRIEKLGQLREKGLLTDEEFSLQKKQILGERI